MSRLKIKCLIRALLGLGRTLVAELDFVTEILRQGMRTPASKFERSATGVSVIDALVPPPASTSAADYPFALNLASQFCLCRLTNETQDCDYFRSNVFWSSNSTC
jgi:hypothetical protein